MNGNRALRIVGYLSLSIGIGILGRGAWGFVVFGILVLLDNFIPSREPAPPPSRNVPDRDNPEP